MAADKNANDKQTALESALKQIEKQYGQGAIMRLGKNSALNVDAISTGSLTLDIATGIGGLPKGRIIEIYGPESSGKTTLALHCVAEAQKAGGEAAFIDAEHALDPSYAANLGVDVDSLLVSQQITANKLSKSRNSLSATVQLILSLLTLLLHLFHVRKSRAIWATLMSACTQGLCRRHSESLQAPLTSRIALLSLLTNFVRRSALFTAVLR